MIRRTLDRILEQQITAYVIVSFILFFLLLPLLWMLLSSFKTMSELFQSPPTYWPHDFTLEAYSQAWNKAPLPT